MRLVGGLISLVFVGLFFSRYVLFLFIAAVIGGSFFGAQYTFSSNIIPNFIQEQIKKQQKEQKVSSFSADKTIEGVKRLIISGSGVQIKFDSALNGVKFPSEMEVKQSEDTLDISFKNQSGKKAEIVIGTALPYDEILINSDGARVIGSSKLLSNKFKVRGTAAYLNCTVQSSLIEVGGDDLKFDMDISSAKKIVVEGSAVDGTITYADSWTGDRGFMLKGTGNIKVLVPSASKGLLKVNDKNSVKVEKY